MTRLVLPLLLVLVAGRSGLSAERLVAEEYPGGKKKASYFVNERGQKHGLCEEFYPDGQRKSSAQYAEGELHGQVSTFAPDGSPERLAGYRHGKLHGRVREYVERTLTRDEFYADGVLLVPKSRHMIAGAFEYLSKSSVRTVGEFPKVYSALAPRLEDPKAQQDREQAVRNLRCYRYLCDLPYSDLALDRQYIAQCEAASDILSAIGRLDHHPPNPGWPEADYQLATAGTGRSNISMGGDQMSSSVNMFMNDSDAGNIRELGHRRWCLNPRMSKTGFGRSGAYGAMYSMDGSRDRDPDYEAVMFPPRGLTPVEAFKEGYAWSVTVNPARFQPPQEDQVKVSLVAARLDPNSGVLEKESRAFPLEYFRVSNAGYGVSNCIIFRPAALKVESGLSYWCEISGLKTASGAPTTLKYFVGFFKLKP